MKKFTREGTYLLLKRGYVLWSLSCTREESGHLLSYLPGHRGVELRSSPPLCAPFLNRKGTQPLCVASTTKSGMKGEGLKSPLPSCAPLSKERGTQPTFEVNAPKSGKKGKKLRSSSPLCAPLLRGRGMHPLSVVNTTRRNKTFEWKHFQVMTPTCHQKSPTLLLRVKALRRMIGQVTKKRSEGTRSKQSKREEGNLNQ